MQLQELIARLDELDEDAIICAKQPWSASTDAELVEPDENLAVPENMRRAGFVYLLEVHVAKEAVEVFGDRPPSLDETVRLLIHYAENDAYPEWVYER